MRTESRLSGRLTSIERRMRFEPSLQDMEMSVRPVRDPSERQAASRLVGRMYHREGYLKREPLEKGARAETSHIGFHHLLEEAVVFIATTGRRVTGTATALLDSPAGLPLEALYRDTVQVFRRQQMRLGEVCSLAIDSEGAQDRATILGLISEMFRFFYTQSDRDAVLITLKPSHRRFYERLGFQSCGPIRLDPRFQRAETIIMSINRERAGGIMKSLNLAGREPLSDKPPPESRPAPAEILEWCLRHPRILSKASARQRGHLLTTLRRHSSMATLGAV